MLQNGLNTWNGNRWVASSLTISNQKPRVNFHLFILKFVSIGGHSCKYFKISNTQGCPNVVKRVYVRVEILVEFDAC